MWRKCSWPASRATAELVLLIRCAGPLPSRADRSLSSAPDMFVSMGLGRFYVCQARLLILFGSVEAWCAGDRCSAVRPPIEGGGPCRRPPWLGVGTAVKRVRGLRPPDGGVPGETGMTDQPFPGPVEEGRRGWPDR